MSSEEILARAITTEELTGSNQDNQA